MKDHLISIVVEIPLDQMSKRIFCFIFISDVILIITNVLVNV